MILALVPVGLRARGLVAVAIILAFVLSLAIVSPSLVAFAILIFESSIRLAELVGRLLIASAGLLQNLAAHGAGPLRFLLHRFVVVELLVDGATGEKGNREENEGEAKKESFHVMSLCDLNIRRKPHF